MKAPIKRPRAPQGTYVVGRQFHRMTLVEQRGPHPSGPWLVRCACGAEKVVAANDCRRGRVKSCGCLMIELLKGRAKAAQA